MENNCENSFYSYKSGKLGGPKQISTQAKSQWRNESIIKAHIWSATFNWERSPLWHRRYKKWSLFLRGWPQTCSYRSYRRCCCCCCYSTLIFLSHLRSEEELNLMRPNDSTISQEKKQRRNQKKPQIIFFRYCFAAKKI